MSAGQADDGSAVVGASPGSPADKPTDSLIAAQAAVSPPTARMIGRGIADDATGKAPPRSTDPTDDAGQADAPEAASSPVAATPSPMMANPLMTLPSLASASPNGSPAPIDAAAPAGSTQPRPTTLGQSARTTKTTSDPAEGASLPTPAPGNVTPEVAPSSTPAPAQTIPAFAAPGIAALAASTPVSKPDAPLSRPSSPAAQVAQAIVEPVKVMMSSPAQTAATASHVTTIQITPVELGRVDIRIERPDDGPTRIQLVAERPETLSRLVHDQSQLHQALDQAGVPQTGRMLDFSLAPAPTPEFSASSSFTGSSTNGGSSSWSEQQRSNGTYGNRTFATANEPVSVVASHFLSARAGIDITA